MPGSAFTKPPIKNSFQVNPAPIEAYTTAETIPQTMRPQSIAVINDIYSDLISFSILAAKIPVIIPYVASSNAMHTAFGKSAGMPNRTPRKSGVINPINRPYGHPQIYPHNSTGICIGQSIFPIAGICIVIKGRISPIARNIAARILFLKAIFSLISKFSFCLLFITTISYIFLFVFLFYTNVCVQFYSTFA